jgi:hypothetical protein
VETLIWIEPDHKRLAYTVTDSPLPVARFETVVSVTTAAEHGATCRIVFDVDYQPKDDDSSARESVDMVYGLIGDWLEEAATSTN